mgnify:CR=1 FL=1
MVTNFELLDFFFIQKHLFIFRFNLDDNQKKKKIKIERKKIIILTYELKKMTPFFFLYRTSKAVKLWHVT